MTSANWRVLTLLIVLLGVSSTSSAQECKKCVREKLAGSAEETAVAASLAAIAGLAVLAPPGAVCAAVIAAAGGTALSKMIGIAQCDKICIDEANQKSDPRGNVCTDLMGKVRIAGIWTGSCIRGSKSATVVIGIYGTSATLNSKSVVNLQLADNNKAIRFSEGDRTFYGSFSSDLRSLTGQLTKGGSSASCKLTK